MDIAPTMALRATAQTAVEVGAALREEVDSNFGQGAVKFEEIQLGKYNRCHDLGQPIVWFLVVGHFRSFAKKIENFDSFVSSAGVLWWLCWPRLK